MISNDDNKNKNDVHSIEHVVPKSLYITSYGKRTNPLNFMPSHRSVNSDRGTLKFDFDGDIVQSKTTAKVVGDDRELEGGVDKDKECDVPEKTRGDIERY